MRPVVTLAAQGDAPALEGQLRFHLHAGAAAIVVGDDGLSAEGREALDRLAGDGRVLVVEGTEGLAKEAVTEAGADWVIPTAADEFWWPRGARYDDILSRIPNDYGVVQALVRPFLRVEGSPRLPFEPAVHRLSAQASANEPGTPPHLKRRLAHRAGVDIGDYAGEVVDSALRPLRGWYPIEVLWHPSEAAWPAWELDAGVERGVVQVDTRLRDTLRALEAGEHVELSRPSVVENAWYAADAAVLTDADRFRLRDEMDELERRLAELEESVLVRLDRKLRSILRRGRGRP